MSRPFEFNGIPVKTPDTFQPSMATTSTEDSDRTQDLVMHNTPIGTIASYSFEWKYIEPDEAAKIVQQIKNKNQYTLRYMRPDTGGWSTGYFYTSNYNFGTLTVANGDFVWESLSFNAVGVYPI
jgi:hypothetical protein